MTPDAAVAPPDCSQARAGEILPGTTLAFLAGAGARVAAFQVVAATGCWARLAEYAAAGGIADLSIEAGGRYLYASTRVAERVTGVEAFRIDAAHGALELIGRFPLGQDAFDAPGPILATADSVYIITRPIATGYHGGLWRFAIDPGSGWLDWRPPSFHSREPAFLEWWPSRSLLYVWMEELGGSPPYGHLRALRIGGGGDPSRAAFVAADWGQAEADPAGAFLWMTQGDTGFETLDAYVPGADGALTRASTTPWQRRGPAAHPSGLVLYALSGSRLDSFAVDRGNGAPRLVTSAAAPPDARAPFVDPTGTFVYVSAADTVRGYRTDAGGTLLDLGPVTAGGGGAIAFLTVR